MQTLSERRLFFTVFLCCSLSELPENHLIIAGYEGCLEQLTCVSLAPLTESFYMQLVGTIFVRVAYTPATHSSLAKPLLIRRLLDVCDGDRGRRSDHLEVLMIRYE